MSPASTRSEAVPADMRQLACAYFPTSPTPRAAATRLRRWIAADRQLQKALLEAHWRSTQHRLTPRQLQVFVRIMGRP